MKTNTQILIENLPAILAALGSLVAIVLSALGYKKAHEAEKAVTDMTEKLDRAGQ